MSKLGASHASLSKQCYVKPRELPACNDNLGSRLSHRSRCRGKCLCGVGADQCDLEHQMPLPWGYSVRCLHHNTPKAHLNFVLSIHKSTLSCPETLWDDSSSGMQMWSCKLGSRGVKALFPNQPREGTLIHPVNVCTQRNSELGRTRLLFTRISVCHYSQLSILYLRPALAKR
jgi:hypothetical protein